MDQLRADVDGHVRFDIRGVSPVHGGEPTSPEQEKLMYYGPQFSRGHFNQHTGVRGSIKVGDEVFPLDDAYGWRDHSWGPRNWHAKIYLRWLIAGIDDANGFMLTRAVGPTTQTRSGFVLDCLKFQSREKSKCRGRPRKLSDKNVSVTDVDR